jgi:hypothetical protein
LAAVYQPVFGVSDEERDAFSGMSL